MPSAKPRAKTTTPRSPARAVRKGPSGAKARKPAAASRKASKPATKVTRASALAARAAGKPLTAAQRHALTQPFPKGGKKGVKYLSGGNPQVAKADGDAPVQAYIDAIPVAWQRDVARRLDALIVANAPGVRKAVKWNSPFYGARDQPGWFVSFHVFTNYLKVVFFFGTSLRPVPPGGQQKDARWVDVRADDLDEAKVALWVKQAAAIPGWGK